MKYEIVFKNGTKTRFSSDVDVDLHSLAMNQPLVFDDLLVNLPEVIIIKKDQEV